MATSSSDESCSAPTDFDISSLDESNGKSSVTSERCPLCKKSKRTYYCKDCLRNGDFVHSTFSRFSERFFDKKVRLFQLSRDRQQSLDRVNEAFEPITKAEELKLELEACRKKVEVLKLVIEETRDATAKAKHEIQQNDEYIANRRKTNALYAEKIRKMRRHKEALLTTFDERLEQLDGFRGELKRAVGENINSLVQLIFPISRVCFDDSNDDSLAQDTISALAEATRTAYVKGRWIYTDNTGDIQFRIVESMLPGNGDYSFYGAWVASNKESVPSASSELSHRSSGCAISAALTYICQFVSIMASFLDIHLPKRLCYSEFCTHELSKQDFANKVAKLNANILHICLSQNVNPDHLHPRHTAANLMLLLDPNMCDLGRCGAFEVNTDILKSMEESLLQDLDASGDSDDEWQEEMEIVGHWETIPEPRLLPARGVTASAMPTVAPQRLHRGPLPSEAATSVAGGLVMSAAASVVSLWKAAIGHR